MEKCLLCEESIEEGSQYFPHCSAKCKRHYKWDLYPSFSSYCVRTTVFFICLMIFGIIYSIILSGEGKLYYNYLFVVSLLSVMIAFLFFIKTILEIRASKNWPNVEGKIIVSNLRKSSNDRFQPDIIYSYNVAGRDYQAKKIIIGQLWGSTGPAWANHIVTRYPKGRIVNVYHNPKSPKKALLEPGLNSQFLTLWFRLVPITLVIIVPIVTSIISFL